MTQPVKSSPDQFLSSRQADGDIAVKLFKAPASWDPEKRSARFVMSSEAPDRLADVVVQAGMDLTEFLKNPIALLMHQSRQFPVGNWSDIEKMTNTRPPRTEGTLNLLAAEEDETVDRLATHIGKGTIRACSIGFMPLDVELIRDKDDNWTGGFKINESELYECSPVTIPAHPRALVKAAGNDDARLRLALEQTIDEFGAELEEVGVSRDLYIEAMAKIVPSRTIAEVKGIGEKPRGLMGLIRSMVKREVADQAPPQKPETKDAAAENAATPETPPAPAPADPEVVKRLVAEAEASKAGLIERKRLVA